MQDYPQDILKRPFGEDSRLWLLEEYFDNNGVPTIDNAWMHVYKLLLWVDSTISLAHCYESDKAQPGRHWYSRSLAFHSWVSNQFGCSPIELHENIDYLFKRAAEIISHVNLEKGAALKEKARQQRSEFEKEVMPEPGHDPELEEKISNAILSNLDKALYDKTCSSECASAVRESVSTYLVNKVSNLAREKHRLENKRKNLVGEGFEDVLGSIASRAKGLESWTVYTRRLLHEIPGFREPPANEKVRRVDFAMMNKESGKRVLATVKWSVRADREEQFAVDFDSYTRNEASGEAFDFVLITNEFDAARLLAACKRRHATRPLFDRIVHVNPEGVKAVYGDKPRNSAREVVELIDSGRISSLSGWLKSL